MSARTKWKMIGREPEQWYVIGRGFAGWHARGINVSSSGGDLEPRPWGAGGMTTGYLSEAIDGCLIYDAIDADPAAFTRLVLAGPMVDPKLPADGVDRFANRATAAAMAPALVGAFGTIAALASTPSYGGLDTVGVGVFRALLATVPGIKLGTVIGGVIRWDLDADQPALPGAEAVRSIEAPLPQFDLPEADFQLTAPAETQPTQTDLLRQGGL